MTNQNDSFIDEVTEELRRDRLFRAFRRFGWIALGVILVIVGGTAWREYTAHRDTQRAQIWGDAVLAAESTPDPVAAIAAIDPQQGAGRAMLGAMLAAALAEGEDSATNAQRLRDVAGEASRANGGPGGTALLRELALLKAVMEDPNMDLAARDELLTQLSQPGAPFRLLALEQKAIVLIGAGRDTDAATLIRQIQREDGLTEAMRRRLAATLIALGDEDPPETDGVLSGTDPLLADPLAAPLTEPLSTTN